ncbi:lysophospholipid acyltransferase family protein [Desulfohalovibrio reitneri]|uniref:lysophospholipid acyltransferase family protein n=1 Tax=Desulfohalovibrio reitneri TaxID=1307759 RepID=UPI0004A78669|nr:GNAT family N-acyltransferase [Desulfohalovibrio reitneri]
MPQAQSDELIRIPVPGKGPLRRKLFSMLCPSLGRLIGLSHINRIYANAHCGDSDEFLSGTLRELGVKVQVRQEDLERIPKVGPCVVVANHPFGAVEGIILADILRSIRPDAKLMANYLLAQIPEMRDIIIQVDPFGSQQATSRNIAPLKESLRWLRQGGLLGVFPAGEVSAFNLRQRAVADKEWSPTVGGIIRKTGAPVVPVYFKGSNRALFHLLGLIHPRLRTVMLPREVLKRRNTTIEMRIGQPIPKSKMQGFESDEKLMEWLKLRTYVLGSRENGEEVKEEEKTPQAMAEVAAPQEPDALAGEIDSLPDEQKLIESDPHLVFVCKKEQAPVVLKEIGRLREITFRAVGEGTGRDSDLDEFDEYYHHLVLYNREDREIMGAYRLGPVKDILREHGRDGLYSNTLFTLKKKFLDRIGEHGLEMGRSFVQQKYQKGYAPLLLLWKGIAAYVVAHPDRCILFGPVSITNDYHSFSRELMVRFLSQRERAEELTKTVKPKSPPKLPHLAGLVVKTARTVCRDIDDLASLISEVETDQKGVPVLLRQYLKLGGKLLAFNVDQDFFDALDGLIMVDLRKTDRKILSRYMGKEAVGEFLDHHGSGQQNEDGTNQAA